MSGYRTVQRRLQHRGREFHFVSYEGQANPRRAEDASAPTWYLIAAGKRWPVMPQEPNQDLADVDERLLQWLDEHVFAPRPTLDGSDPEESMQHMH